MKTRMIEACVMDIKPGFKTNVIKFRVDFYNRLFSCALRLQKIVWILYSRYEEIFLLFSLFMLK